MYTFEILPVSHNLKFTLTEDGKRHLQECQSGDPEGFTTNNFMYEFFEDLVCNDEYEWSCPEYIGALTDAPILAIYDEEVQIPDNANEEFDVWHRVTSYCGLQLGGRNLGYYTPVYRAWAYMNYMVDTPQEELLRTGSCTWQCGYWTTEDGEVQDESEY